MPKVKVIRTEIDLTKLVKMDEEKCRARLIEIRWPNGIECPRCHSHHIGHVYTRHQFRCFDCHYMFSVTAGTSLQDTPIPLQTWFMIIVPRFGKQRRNHYCPDFQNVRNIVQNSMVYPDENKKCHEARLHSETVGRC